jgi:hypothetical protein
MNTRLFSYAFGMWILLVILAILNGILRESLIKPRVSEQTAHVMSTIILICIFFIAIYLFFSNLKIGYSKMDLLLVGVFWLILTVAFEFLFGHYVMGHPWSKLLADYNILQGRLWPLVLLAVFIAPVLFGSIAKSSE